MPDVTAFQLFGYIAAALALQILLAGAIAVLRRRPKIRQLLTDTASQKTPQGAWVGWRDFRVV
ncbi:MAG: hypothetical protein KJ961_01845, partial [Alphaproteobacteria bacterium]|nr:hypothetical protein [Alphaproteobacteria bacterium]